MGSLRGEIPEKALSPGFEICFVRALAEHDLDADPLRVAERLRRELPAADARLALLLWEGRRRARGRIPGGEGMFWTRRSLEQATHPEVAAWRAAELRRLAPGATVADLTSGAGGDSLALAAAGLRVLSADRDPLLARCAAANLTLAGLPARVVVADATRPLDKAELLVLDPDRRAEGRRSMDPERWAPRASRALELARARAGACLKLAPALDPGRLALPADLPHAWRWVARGGELAELSLWTGVLAAGVEPGVHEALAVGSGADGVARLSGRPDAVPPAEPLAADEAARAVWLFEPDPAVIRARLVDLLAQREGLAPVGPGIAYLAGAGPCTEPLLTAYRVLGSAPADPRRVRALLGEHDVGPVTVKKRGHPDPSEVLERRFRGPGGRRGLLIVARLARGHRAWLVERAC